MGKNLTSLRGSDFENLLAEDEVKAELVGGAFPIADACGALADDIESVQQMALHVLLPGRAPRMHRRQESLTASVSTSSSPVPEELVVHLDNCVAGNRRAYIACAGKHVACWKYVRINHFDNLETCVAHLAAWAIEAKGKPSTFTKLKHLEFSPDPDKVSEVLPTVAWRHREHE